MIFRMDVILASSRGKGLEELMKPLHPSPHKLTVIYSSGARMQKLINQATNILAHTPNPHDYHIYIIGGYCDINERIQPSISPLTQHPQQTSPLRRIHFQRKQTSSYIQSHQPHHKSIRPNSLPTRTTHHLHKTTLKLRHMESHTPQPTQNSNAQILPAIP